MSVHLLCVTLSKKPFHTLTLVWRSKLRKYLLVSGWRILRWILRILMAAHRICIMVPRDRLWAHVTRSFKLWLAHFRNIVVFIQFDIFRIISTVAVFWVQLQALPFSFEGAVPVHVERALVFPFDAESTLELVPVLLDGFKEFFLEILVIYTIQPESENDFVGNLRQI